MPMVNEAIDSLTAWFEQRGQVAVAVSGGVDSLTLSAIAYRALGSQVKMYHAVSPAVPKDATERTRQLAASAGWMLEIFDAGEFANAQYRANPVDRCYYCKQSLYGAIACRTEALMVSGTNTEDLSDFRPGLHAAAEHGVRHPYVELHIDKTGVRHIAKALGLGEVAELPAAPCLASRVETGIAIEDESLAAVYAAEQLVQQALAPATVRCRVRHAAIVIELDEGTFFRLTAVRRDQLAGEVASLYRRIGLERPVQFSAYRMGSAFLHAGNSNASAHG